MRRIYIINLLTLYYPVTLLSSMRKRTIFTCLKRLLPQMGFTRSEERITSQNNLFIRLLKYTKFYLYCVVVWLSFLFIIWFLSVYVSAIYLPWRSTSTYTVFSFFPLKFSWRVIKIVLCHVIVLLNSAFISLNSYFV